MKLRILPILLLLGLLTFGPTQSDPTQAYNLHQQTLADASQPHPTPALPTDTPAKTAKSVSTPTAQSAQDEQAETPRITQGPVPTGTASATTLNAALKIETGATSIGPAFEQFLEQAGAVVETPDPGSGRV